MNNTEQSNIVEVVALPNRISPEAYQRFVSGLKVSDSGCWEWQRCASGGYGSIYVKGKRYSTHRLSWLIYRGDIPKGIFICHKCDNPPCCNPDHLFLGDIVANTLDMVSKNRHPKGNGHGLSKLDDKKVDQIIQRLRLGEVREVIAKDFGVTHKVIHQIANNETWTHMARESIPTNAHNLVGGNLYRWLNENGLDTATLPKSRTARRKAVRAFIDSIQGGQYAQQPFKPHYERKRAYINTAFGEK